MMLIQNSVNSYWLFNTQSRVLRAGWLRWENNEKATLDINMPYSCYKVMRDQDQHISESFAV